jgi:hypothetical protein
MGCFSSYVQFYASSTLPQQKPNSAPSFSIVGAALENFEKKKSLKYIFIELNVIDMVCWINSHQEKSKKNHGIPSITGQNTVVSRLDMYRTKVLMYRTMVLLARPTKVRR